MIRKLRSALLNPTEHECVHICVHERMLEHFRQQKTHTRWPRLRRECHIVVHTMWEKNYHTQSPNEKKTRSSMKQVSARRRVKNFFESFIPSSTEKLRKFITTPHVWHIVSLLHAAEFDCQTSSAFNFSINLDCCGTHMRRHSRVIQLWWQCREFIFGIQNS